MSRVMFLGYDLVETRLVVAESVIKPSVLVLPILFWVLMSVKLTRSSRSDISSESSMVFSGCCRFYMDWSSVQWDVVQWDVEQTIYCALWNVRERSP